MCQQLQILVSFYAYQSEQTGGNKHKNVNRFLARQRRNNLFSIYRVYQGFEQAEHDLEGLVIGSTKFFS